MADQQLIELTALSTLTATHLFYAVDSTGVTDYKVAGSVLDARYLLVVGTDVQAYDADLTAIAALSSADSNIIVGSATGWVAESGGTARTSLGVAIGSDVQAYQDNAFYILQSQVFT